MNYIQLYGGGGFFNWFKNLFTSQPERPDNNYSSVYGRVGNKYYKQESAGDLNRYVVFPEEPNESNNFGIDTQNDTIIYNRVLDPATIYSTKDTERKSNFVSSNVANRINSGFDEAGYIKTFGDKRGLKLYNRDKRRIERGRGLKRVNAHLSQIAAYSPQQGINYLNGPQSYDYTPYYGSE